MAGVEKFTVKIPAELLRDRRKVLEGFRKATRDTIRKNSDKIQRDMRRLAPKNTGKLQKSIRFQLTKRPEEEGADIKMLAYGLAQNNSFKTRSPVSPRHLLPWVRSTLGLRGKEALRAAFAIGHKLRNIGGPGKNSKTPVRFVERALDGVLKGREVQRTFQREVRKKFPAKPR